LWCRSTPVHDWKRSAIALHPLCMYGARLGRMCISKFERNTNTVSYDRIRCNRRCRLTPMYTKKWENSMQGSRAFKTGTDPQLKSRTE
jgi:hypothetical protein